MRRIMNLTKRIERLYVDEGYRLFIIGISQRELKASTARRTRLICMLIESHKEN